MFRAKTAVRSTEASGEIPDGVMFYHGFTDKKGIAERYCVSERTVDNWIRARRIPVIKCNRVARFHVARCDAALARFEVKEVAS